MAQGTIMNKPIPMRFFMAHAGYSYDPKTQTPMQGRRQCALALAAAEASASERGDSFEWGIDQYTDSSDWSDDPNPWRVWNCSARDCDGKVYASLNSIDFGRDGEPWSSPYRRVVEAELAMEYKA